MRTLIYGLICEDNTQKVFLEHLLNAVSGDNTQFQINSKFYNDLKCRNKDDVRNKMVQAADYSFLHKKGFYCDIVFVGIDYDDRPRPTFDSELTKLYDKIDTRAKLKVIIFFPVQAIEHWFLLLKHRKESPASTKNIASEIESINRKAAKEKLYINPDKNEIIETLLLDADFDWLQNQSQSFRSFYVRLNGFISTHGN